jgi:hypothetical protein
VPLAPRRSSRRRKPLPAATYRGLPVDFSSSWSTSARASPLFFASTAGSTPLPTPFPSAVCRSLAGSHATLRRAPARG